VSSTVAEVLYAGALDRGFADDFPDRFLRDVDEAVERVEMMLRNLRREGF
jgi:hypothetical protein